MVRSARVLTAFLLVLALAVLAVPLGLHAVPAVIKALEVPEPAPEPATPGIGSSPASSLMN